MRRSLSLVALLALGACQAEGPPGPTLEGTDPVETDSDLAPDQTMEPNTELAPEPESEPGGTIEPEATL